MEKNQLLAKLNAIGSKVGYPFYVYDDGHYSKMMIASDGKRHAVMAVKRPFLDEELHFPFEGNVAALSEVKQLVAIGDKLGYPLYVYADGCCGTQPKETEKGFLFSLKLLKPISANDIVEETMSALVREAMNRRDGFDEKELETFLKFADRTEVRQWVNAGHWCLGAVKLLYQYGFVDALKESLQKRTLPEDEEAALVQLADDELIWLYFRLNEFSDKAECLFVQSGKTLLLHTYIRSYPLDIPAQFKLIECGDVELMGYFAHYRVLSVFVEKRLIETQNEALILAYVSQRQLSEEGEEFLVRLDNPALVQGYLAAHQTFASLDAQTYAQKHQLL